MNFTAWESVIQLQSAVLTASVLVICWMKLSSLFLRKSAVNMKALRSFALIGRPNVGKISLVNAILNEDRVIVSNVEGTTRDAIDTPFKREGKEYVVVDTAGSENAARFMRM